MAVQEILLELLAQLPGGLLLELTLLLAATFVLWSLTPIVNQGLWHAARLTHPVQLIAAVVGMIFTLVLPLALVIWFITIPFRYL